LYRYAESAPTLATDPTGKDSVFTWGRKAVTPRSPADVGSADEHKRRPDSNQESQPREKKSKANPAEKTAKAAEGTDVLDLVKAAKDAGALDFSKEDLKQLGLTKEQAEFIVRYFLIAAEEFEKRGLPAENALLLVAQTGSETSYGTAGSNPKFHNYLSYQPLPRQEAELNKRGIDTSLESRSAVGGSKKSATPHYKDVRESIAIQLDVAYGLDVPRSVANWPGLGQQLKQSKVTPTAYAEAAVAASYVGNPHDPQNTYAHEYPGLLRATYKAVSKVADVAIKRLQAGPDAKAAEWATRMAARLHPSNRTKK
jgi:hypothetical protein